MFYKLLIKNLSDKNEIIILLNTLSHIYIIIDPTSNFSYYIIYVQLTNKNNIKYLQNNNLIINNTFQKKKIYKIIYGYLLNYYEYNLNGHILIDTELYNFNSLKLYNNYSATKFLNYLNINMILKQNLIHYLKFINTKIYWIHHLNNNYVNFIINTIKSLKSNKFLCINYYKYSDLKLLYKNKYKYVILNIKTDELEPNIIKLLINYFNNSIINTFNNIINSELKTIIDFINNNIINRYYKKKQNLLILSKNYMINKTYFNHIYSFTFPKLTH